MAEGFIFPGVQPPEGESGGFDPLGPVESRLPSAVRQLGIAINPEAGPRQDVPMMPLPLGARMPTEAEAPAASYRPAPPTEEHPLVQEALDKAALAHSQGEVRVAGSWRAVADRRRAVLASQAPTQATVQAPTASGQEIAQSLIAAGGRLPGQAEPTGGRAITESLIAAGGRLPGQTAAPATPGGQAIARSLIEAGGQPPGMKTPDVLAAPRTTGGGPVGASGIPLHPEMPTDQAVVGGQRTDHKLSLEIYGPNEPPLEPTYHIVRDGKVVGVADLKVSPDGKTVNVNYMSGVTKGRSWDEFSNTLGPTGVRQLLRDLRTKYPNMEELTGLRVTGARPVSARVSVRVGAKTLEPLSAQRTIEMTPQGELAKFQPGDHVVYRQGSGLLGTSVRTHEGTIVRHDTENGEHVYDVDIHDPWTGKPSGKVHWGYEDQFQHVGKAPEPLSSAKAPSPHVGRLEFDDSHPDFDIAHGTTASGHRIYYTYDRNSQPYWLHVFDENGSKVGDVPAKNSPFEFPMTERRLVNSSPQENTAFLKSVADSVHTFKDYASSSSEHFASPELEAMAKHLSTIIPDTSIYVVPEDKLPVAKRIPGGYFEPITHSIVINKNELDYGAIARDKTLVHEASHASFLQALSQRPDLRRAVNSIGTEARDALLDPKGAYAHLDVHPKDLYAFTLMDEFLAESHSNPRVQNILDQIPASEKLKGQVKALGVKGTFTSLWTVFKGLMFHALGLKTEQATLLDQIIEVTRHLSEHATSRGTAAPMTLDEYKAARGRTLRSGGPWYGVGGGP